MKARYRLTPMADRDLAQIWRHTNENWGKSQADKYLQLLEKGFLKLLHHPILGRSRDEIRKGYRSLPVENHVAFYRVNEKDIEIVRILHQRMEVNQHTRNFD